MIYCPYDNIILLLRLSTNPEQFDQIVFIIYNIISNIENIDVFGVLRRMGHIFTVQNKHLAKQIHCKSKMPLMKFGF